MRSIRQYRVTLLLEKVTDPFLFTTINEVNRFVSVANQLNQHLNPNSEDPICLIESYDWDKLEYLPHAFGIIKNKKSD
jgi:hypothetical protein